MNLSLPFPALPLLLLPFTAACRGLLEVSLDPLSDQVDLGGLSDAGQAPTMVHPPGIEFRIEGSYLEEGPWTASARGALMITIHAVNRSTEPLEIPWRKAWLRSDTGQRYTPSRFEIWDEEEEVYRPAPRLLAPGRQAVLVLTIPTKGRLDLLHLVRLCLHWRYRHGGREHRVATRFRVR